MNVVPLGFMVVNCASELYCKNGALTKCSTYGQMELALKWLTKITGPNNTGCSRR